LGLAYSSLGSLYEQQQVRDSAYYFYKLALKDFEKSGNQAYLPNAYINIGESELGRHNDQNGLEYFQKALEIANTTENKQAQASALLAIGRWHLNQKHRTDALHYFQKAHQISEALSDKLFEIMAVEALIEFNEKEKNYFEMSRLQKRLIFLKDQLHSLEREKIVKSLEMQFEVAEKNRKLALVYKRKRSGAAYQLPFGNLYYRIADGINNRVSLSEKQKQARQKPAQNQRSTSWSFGKTAWIGRNTLPERPWP